MFILNILYICTTFVPRDPKTRSPTVLGSRNANDKRQPSPLPQRTHSLFTDQQAGERKSQYLYFTDKQLKYGAIHKWTRLKLLRDPLQRWELS